MTIEEDKAQTVHNHDLLLQNQNLLHWYRNLFELQVDGIDLTQANILEIGSGTSPIKLFYPDVQTSDVLELDYVDFVFDCHHIDSIDEIEDASLDLIVMTNVLHHLNNPISFLTTANSKLKVGGIIRATEPFFSVCSSIIYKYLHHECVDFTIAKPRLDKITGPLSSSNIALPYLIFFKCEKWLNPIQEFYDVSFCSHYTSFSYFATGGISKKILIPYKLYLMLFKLDQWVVRISPLTFSSFFTVQLTKR